MIFLMISPTFVILPLSVTSKKLFLISGVKCLLRLINCLHGNDLRSIKLFFDCKLGLPCGPRNIKVAVLALYVVIRHVKSVKPMY